MSLVKCTDVSVLGGEASRNWKSLYACLGKLKLNPASDKEFGERGLGRCEFEVWVKRVAQAGRSCGHVLINTRKPSDEGHQEISYISALSLGLQVTYS